MPQELKSTEKLEKMIDSDHRRARSIRRYLKNQMEESERYRFEQEIQRDKSLYREVSIYRVMIDELKEMQDSD